MVVKVLALILGCILILAVLNLYFINPALDKGSKCLDNYNKAISAVTEKINNKSQNLEQACIEGKNIILELKTCFNQAANEGSPVRLLVDVLSKDVIKKTIMSQNQACKNYSNALIN